MTVSVLRKFKGYHRYNEDLWGELLARRSLRLVSHLANLFRSLRSPLSSRLRELIATFLPPLPPPSRRRRSGSIYRRQLFAKQKVQLHYRILRDRQLRALVDSASLARGFVESNFIGLLESRLAAAAVRAKFFGTAVEARQAIVHGALLVNGNFVSRCGFRLLPGDLVSLLLPRPLPFRPPHRRSSVRLGNFFRSVSPAAAPLPPLAYPSAYLEVDYSTSTFLFLRTPAPSEVFIPVSLSVADVISYYY